MNKNEEIESVRILGEAIGYGNLMVLASALWRKSLSDSGYPTSGAFIPTCITSVNDKEILDTIDKEIKIYDRYIQEKN